ncbi:pectate lyase-like adhesive domain-containing protein [Kurthia sibirica]|uniref:Bacterial Ig domain-containing protein n=1 Tax=Kurthia sibirica TaxID=202750 RepID=A0A2U3ANQ4_9BACL|nr:pectate lyase-like adhesive domain-containing protein [Kurthia sibirica]PWI26162.1 hypothetical protein DEX24_04355 [Kurthia sibirica]GEK33422.1 hypothetical protein KSI01_09550 [Kurthia sibirica]
MKKTFMLFLSTLLIMNLSIPFSNSQFVKAEETTNVETDEKAQMDLKDNEVVDKKVETDIETDEKAQMNTKDNEVVNNKEKINIETDKNDKKKVENRATNQKTTKMTKAANADELTIITTFAELVAAYKEPTNKGVILANDLANTGNAALITNRTTDFTIDGQGHKLNLGTRYFGVTQSATATFDIRNIEELSATTSRVRGVVASGDANVANSGWTINFTDVKSNENNQTRIASVSGAQLNLAGNIHWKTASEMAVIDGVKIEDNANVVAIKQDSSDNRSFFWYGQSGMNSTSAGTHDFVVGKNAKANFKMPGTGTAYPVVFAYYKKVHLEEGATFNGTMPGNAFRSDYYNSSFIADGNNTINLTSTRNGNSPIHFNSGQNAAEKSQFYVGPNSNLYVIGATNSPLFNASTADGRRTSVIIDSPENIDLRNYSASTTSANSSVAVTNFEEFTIKNSDLDIWRLVDPVTGPSIYYGAQVDYLTQKAGGVMSSSNSGITQYFPTNKVRRISGLNQIPELSFKPITDADKSIYGRIILGYAPDEIGIDDEGNTNYVPVYAGAGQAIAEIEDTYGVTTKTPTENDGYVTVKNDKFNKGNEFVTGKAHKGDIAQEENAEFKVIDITPPEPAKVQTSPIYPDTTVIKGTGEANSDVTMTKNGVAFPEANTTVDAQGDWKIQLPEGSIKKEDVLQIFLRDHAGLAEGLTDHPATNNAVGNSNPATTMTYRDATFKAATKVTVVRHPNIAPVMELTKPVQDGELYNYDPVEEGNSFMTEGTVFDNDSETVTVYAQVDDEAPTKVKTFDESNDKIKWSKEFTKAEMTKLLADEKPHTISYYAIDGDDAKSNSVKFNVQLYTGELKISSAPKDISFGEQLISLTNQKYYIADKDKDLVIEDTRTTGQSWRVTAMLDQELTNDTTNKVIKDAVYYNEATLSTTDAYTVYEKDVAEKGSFNISEKWIDDKKGLNLEMTANSEAGDYSTEVRWSLEDVPGNQ